MNSLEKGVVNMRSDNFDVDYHEKLLLDAVEEAREYDEKQAAFEHQLMMWRFVSGVLAFIGFLGWVA